MNPFVNAPVYIDAVLCLVLAIAALVNYFWLGAHGHSIGRWMQALGYTGLFLRMFIDIIYGNDPHISVAAIAPLTFVAVGSAVTAIQQMRILWADVHCFRDPKFRCYRVDRVKMALREGKPK